MSDLVLHCLPVRSQKWEARHESDKVDFLAYVTGISVNPTWARTCRLTCGGGLELGSRAGYRQSMSVFSLKNLLYTQR